MQNAEKKPRGKRGQGCVYRPKNSSNWWIKFSVGGRVVQQSANTESKRDACDFLKAQILKHSSGEAVGSNKVTIEALRDGMLQTWRNLDKKQETIEWATRCWKHLLPFFGKMKANALSSTAVREYVEYRKGQGAANGTINRELSILSRAFSLAYEEVPRRVSQKLSFTRLPEPKGRQGFVEETQYRALAANCTETYMRTMLALGYVFGFRKAELLTLKVGDVDLLAGTVRLQTSKNGEPRQVNLTGETRQLLGACVAGKAQEDAVFTRNGIPVADFRGTWDAVTKAAGCSGLLFHDLRRSAVRNMVRAGIPEVVCMKISGHKTRAVFDRYNIVSERDLADAARKIESSAEISYSKAKIAAAAAIDVETRSVQNETIQ